MEQLSFLSVAQPPSPHPRVRDLPAQEQPLNRIREVGPGGVSSAELLACLLQTADALYQAQVLLARFEGLPGLACAYETELVQTDGIGPAQAARIKAAFELGRRLLTSAAQPRAQVRSPADLAVLLMPQMGFLERETFVVVLLDTRNRILAHHTLYQGSLNQTQVRVAEVFREAIRRNAAALIIAHNHPSGDPSPSPEDVAITRDLAAAGKLLGIEVLDHLVIGRQRWLSLRERGLGFES